ncbi:MAG: hypothetical protein ACFFE4_20935 [Candidatus Thorarchaeota archaeon]
MYCEHGCWATDEVNGHHHHKRGSDCEHGFWATDDVDGHHHHKRWWGRSLLAMDFDWRTLCVEHSKSGTTSEPHVTTTDFQTDCSKYKKQIDGKKSES